MEFILSRIRRTGVFGWLYGANLFLAFHFFLVHFVDSGFISTLVPSEWIGIVFACGSALALVSLAYATRVLHRIGALRTLAYASILEFALFAGLAVATSPFLLLACFILYLGTVPVILFTLDIFLEAYSRGEESTGNVRGTFLTIATIASLFSPLAAGQLIERGGFPLLYAVGAFALLPFLILMLVRFRGFGDPEYHVFSFTRVRGALRGNHNLIHIAASQFLMRFYFACSVVYLPIYLNTTLGFSWSQVGIILSVMLLPYVLVELPAGIAADRWWGEKELLGLGFVITAIATIATGFLTTPILWLWAALLFASRIGTALMEIMTESYFFKHVQGADADTISFFRMLRPLAYMLGPLFASAILLAYPLPVLWLLLGAVTFYGVVHAVLLVDTK